jgi:hypothetical protein
MRVVSLPPYFDDRALDQVAAGLGGWPPPERLLLDARDTRWVSPYGFTALLALGQALADLGPGSGERPRLTLPGEDEVRSYWAKAGFFQYATALFELHGKVPRRRPDSSSDVLVPVTPIRTSEDVHALVNGLGEQVAVLLREQLQFEARATPRFGMSLSEVCQNVTEHAGTTGWAAVHIYYWKRRLGRRVAVIAVSDGGVGFRASLEPTESRKYGDRWSDGTALEAALIHNVSRFPQPGRGQGLAMIKRYVAAWNGKISIRSGTARLAIVPPWDDDLPLAEGLPFFPGSQVQIVIPEQR